MIRLHMRLILYSVSVGTVYSVEVTAHSVYMVVIHVDFWEDNYTSMMVVTAVWLPRLVTKIEGPQELKYSQMLMMLFMNICFLIWAS